MRLLARFIAFFRQRQHDRDLDQEVEAHLALLVDEYRRRGLGDDEARREARLAFGGVTQLREAHREVRGVSWLEDSLRDLRYAVRGWRRQPGFTSIAVLMLAIGIGANAAMFSVVNAVLIRPLGYRDPDSLFSVARTGGAAPARWISQRRWEVIRDARSFDVGVYRTVADDAILGGREPETLRAARISARVLSILDVRPLLGRSFQPGEDADGAAPVAMISERLWARRFARDPSIVGQTIMLGSTPYAVVGVLGDGFQFPVRDADLWLLQPWRAGFTPPQYYACCTPLMGVARIRPGFTRQQAETELGVSNARYEPQNQRRVDAGPAVLTPLKEDVVGRVDTMLWVLLAAVGLVLLIACANVATLLMARATSRAREFAVRSALGASRWRVIRQLVTESLLLSGAGALVGLLIARAGVNLISTMTLFDLPRAGEIEVSVTVLTWTMAITFVTGVVFGTGPSLQLLKPAIVGRLRQSGSTDTGSNRSRRFGVGTRGALVVTQVALSLILLIGAALMVQTMVRLARVNLGFQSSGLLTMRVPLPIASYEAAGKRSQFFDDLVRRVETIPGVRGATVVRAMPTTGGLATNLQIVSQRIPEPGHVGQSLQTVVPGYFEVMGQPLRQGRLFEARDNAPGAPPVVIVNEAFARRFWPAYPRATPVGEQLFVPIMPSGRLEIIGVVADVHHGGPREREPNTQIYIPDRLYPPQMAFLAVRADGDPLRLVDAIRSQVRALDPNQAVADVNLMDRLIERTLGQQHLATRVLGLFAVTAVVLALTGLYGVMAYSVTQRTPEIGVRRALGAGPRDVLWMVVGQGLRVTIIGIVIGLAGAYASTRFLESLLFDVTTTDVMTFVAVPAAFVVIAGVASLIPALRALRINPAATLRA
jgi:predicted permease